MKTKSSIVTITLGIVIVVLAGSMIIISKALLTDDPLSSGGQTIAARKIKASERTYSKLIALNRVTSVTPSPSVSEDISITPSLSPAPTEVADLTPSPSETVDQELSGTPTPTEIILAYQNTTPGASESSSLSPTGVENLPESGNFNNALILFAVSAVFIFLSFIF